MSNITILQSSDPDIDTLKCPKCNALWRAKGHYNYDEGGWGYENGEDVCPCGCLSFFGFHIKGKITKK